MPVGTRLRGALRNVLDSRRNFKPLPTDRKLRSGLAPPPLADEDRLGHTAGPHGRVDGMRCVGCGSEAVTERPERTAQGYRRFRCRSCGKQSNERSGTVLNRTQYP